MKKMYSATKAKVERLARPLVEQIPKEIQSGAREVEINKIIVQICTDLGYTNSDYYGSGTCPFY